jgi:hypothetical protein
MKMGRRRRCRAGQIELQIDLEMKAREILFRSIL